MYRTKVLPWCRAETCFKYVPALVSFGEGATKQPFYVWIDRAIPQSRGLHRSGRHAKCRVHERPKSHTHT